MLRLIRTPRLSVRESLVWLLSTLAAIAVTAFPSVLVWAAHLVGIRVPSNAIFGAGVLYLALNVLAVTLSASANTAHVRRLTQEFALLRAEIAALRAATAQPGSPPGDGERAPPAGRTSAR